jgi:hypothetical protein
MLFMKMGKECISIERVALQPRQVTLWIYQDFIRQVLNGSEEFLE